MSAKQHTFIEMQIHVNHDTQIAKRQASQRLDAEDWLPHQEWILEKLEICTQKEVLAILSEEYNFKAR